MKIFCPIAVTIIWLWVVLLLKKNWSWLSIVMSALYNMGKKTKIFWDFSYLVFFFSIVDYGKNILDFSVIHLVKMPYQIKSDNLALLHLYAYFKMFLWSQKCFRKTDETVNLSLKKYMWDKLTEFCIYRRITDLTILRHCIDFACTHTRGDNWAI